MASSGDFDFGDTIRGFVEGQQAFGRYQLRRILGRGGMGLVWRAWDERLEREVALKFMPEMVRLDSSAIDDLKREARKSLDLTHPNIVRIYDFVQDEMSAAIAMEYVDGPTLATLRVEKPSRVFEPEEILGWVKQLCEALDYAHHEARIVHRDLKPANLMVNSANRLKVTDFGIARSISDSVSRMTIASGDTSGTLAYMSPQQAIGAKASSADDIYSLGATLYDLLTGKPPFHSGNIYAQVKEVIPPSMTERRAELETGAGKPLPEAWEQAIAACLDKDLAVRPATAREVAERLADLSRGGPVEITASAASRSKKAAWVFASFLALLAAVAGWYFTVEAPRQQVLSVRATEEARQSEAQKAEQAKQEAMAQLRAEEAEKKAAAEALQAKTTGLEQEIRLAIGRQDWNGADQLVGELAKWDGTNSSLPGFRSSIEEGRAEAAKPKGVDAVPANLRQWLGKWQVINAREWTEDWTGMGRGTVRYVPDQKGTLTISAAEDGSLQASGSISAWVQMWEGKKVFRNKWGWQGTVQSVEQASPDALKLRGQFSLEFQDSGTADFVILTSKGFLIPGQEQDLSSNESVDVKMANSSTPSGQKLLEAGVVSLPAAGFFSLNELFAHSPYANYNTYSKTQILRKVQDRLRGEGNYLGKSDGSVGPETQKAIFRLQQGLGISETGEIDSATLAALGMTGISEMSEPVARPQVTPLPKSKSAGKQENAGGFSGDWKKSMPEAANAKDAF